jgi:hypothetical protein
MSSSTLRFQIDVAADKATEALKAVTAAVNEAGVKMRGSFSAVGPAVRAAGADIGGLGESVKRFAAEQRSEARTASFFVREIAQIVPISSQARDALTQFGGALVGGGVVGIGIAAASVGLSYLAEHFREVSEAAQRAAEANARAIDALQGRLEAVRRARMSPAEVEKESIDVLRMQMEGNNALIAGLEKRNALIRDQIKYLEYTPRELGENEQRIRQAREQNYQLERRIALGAETIRYHLENASAAKAEADAARAIADQVKRAADEARRLKKEMIDALAAPMRAGKGFLDALKERERKDAEAAKESVEAWEEAEAKKARAFQKTAAAYGAVLDTIASSFTSALMDMAFTEKTWGEASKEMLRSVLDAMLAQLQQLLVAKITAAFLEKGVKQGIAISEISANAGIAGSGAAASQAAIPFAGPELALAAMAATSEAVLGAMLPLASAAQGFDVPAGFNGLVNIHSREMVLPEQYADVIRRGGGGDVNITVPALDGRSVERVFLRNDNAIRRTLRRARRRGRPV